MMFSPKFPGFQLVVLFFLLGIIQLLGSHAYIMQFVICPSSGWDYNVVPCSCKYDHGTIHRVRHIYHNEV